MTNPRQLAAAAYLVAFTLIAIPLFDATMATVPFHLGSPQWRFATAGLVSNSLLVPTLGALIAVVTAVTQGHTRSRMLLAFASWMMVLVMVGLLGLFALDAIQTRSLVREELRLSFVLASATAACKLGLTALTFATFGWAAHLPRSRGRKTSAPFASSLLREVGSAASVS
jgi:hypothetical protein